MVKFNRRGQMVVDTYDGTYIGSSQTIPYVAHKQTEGMHKKYYEELVKKTFRMIKYDNARKAYMDSINPYEFEENFEWFLVS
jgi:hypothetical protein